MIWEKENNMEVEFSTIEEHFRSMTSKGEKINVYE
jgi:hypothetical protein